MDYAELAEVRIHEDWQSCQAVLDASGTSRLFAASTRGRIRYDAPRYLPGDAFIFGPESRGLPEHILSGINAERRIRLPMQPGCRSLNLSNTVAVVAYEAWRQNGFQGGE